MPPKETVVPGVLVPTASEFAWRVPILEEAEFKYCIVEEPRATTEARVLAPAARVFAPMLIEPKPFAIEPEESAPTWVSDEPVMPVPKVVEFKTGTLLIRNEDPAGRLTVEPLNKEIPANVEVDVVALI
jgi:hypothetical protein